MVANSDHFDDVTIVVASKPLDTLQSDSSYIPLSVFLLPKRSKSLTKDYFCSPIIHYSFADQISLGTYFTNAYDPLPNTHYTIKPMYSLFSQSIIGDAAINHFVKSKIIKDPVDQLQIGLSTKSYHHEYNKKFDNHLRYLKLSAYSKLIDHNVDHDEKTELTIQASRIIEQRAIFESQSQFTNENVSFWTIDLIFHKSKNNSINPFDITVAIRSIPKYFNNNYFSRLDVTLNRKWTYLVNRNFYARVYSAYFILNSQRKLLSYNNFTTKGSAGLFYTSNNDYNYDSYFLDRVNPTIIRPHNQQGNFKNSFTVNTPIGQSNHMINSLNLILDAPFFPFQASPLKFYFDIGTYATPSNNKYNHNLLYSAGISLSFFQEALNITLPIINSEEIENNYVANQQDFMNRISINFDVLRLSLFRNSEKLLKKY